VDYLGAAGEKRGVATTADGAIGIKQEERTNSLAGTLQSVANCLADSCRHVGQIRDTDPIERLLDAFALRVETSWHFSRDPSP